MKTSKLCTLYETLNYKFRRKNYKCMMPDDNHITLKYKEYDIMIEETPLGMTAKSRPKGTILAHGLYVTHKCPNRKKMLNDVEFEKFWLRLDALLKSQKLWKNDYRKFYEESVEPLF